MSKHATTSSYREVESNEITYNSWIKSKTRTKLASLQKACEKKVSELVTSQFSTSSTGSLVLRIVLTTTRAFLVVNTIGKAGDLGTLSYHLTDNS